MIKDGRFTIVHLDDELPPLADVERLVRELARPEIDYVPHQGTRKSFEDLIVNQPLTFAPDLFIVDMLMRAYAGPMGALEPEPMDSTKEGHRVIQDLRSLFRGDAIGRIEILIYTRLGREDRAVKAVRAEGYDVLRKGDVDSLPRLEEVILRLANKKQK